MDIGQQQVPKEECVKVNKDIATGRETSATAKETMTKTQASPVEKSGGDAKKC